MNDNICAISSGLINQAISIIRIVGPEAQQILQKIFTGKIGGDAKISYGWIIDQNKKPIDEVLVSCFIGKNNYVGEDTFEINAHGGVVVTNMILELILANGARMAEPGEFSQRAFLNGRLDLVKAEAINNLIHAKTKMQAQAAINKFDGKTSKLLDKLITKLLYLIGICETNIDYPEYDDVESVENKDLIIKLNEIKQDLEEIIEISETNSQVINGISIAIVGSPNVGKSSLLNLFLGKEKAIVTNIEGTTRDIVEEDFLLSGILFKLKDTAGIRRTDNKIEKIGIKKSFNTINESKVILHLIDSLKKETQYDQEIENLSKDKVYIKIYNKSDLVKIKILKQNHISLSVLNNEIEELKKLIIQNFQNIDFQNEKMIYSTRHLSLIKKADLAIKQSLQSVNKGMTADIVITDITEAWEALTNINGRADNEKLLDSIFSTFCLGK